ncbi:MAG: CHAT domain-containing protein [Cyanobacteria bacterium P01_F01_bin.13]
MKKLLYYGVLFCFSWLLLVSMPVLAQVSQPPAQSGPTLVEQGRRYYAQGDWESAISTWQTVLPQLTDPAQTAAVWTYLGLAHQKQGDLIAAAKALDTSLHLLAPLPDDIRAPIQAQALNAQGQLALTRGRPEAAFTYWQQTTKIYQALDHSSGVTGSRINQARALEMSGHYRRACQTLLNAFRIENPSCDFSDAAAIAPVMSAFETEADPQLKLLGLTSLGNVLRLKGYLPQAQQLLEAGVDLAQTLGQPDAIVTTQLSLGKIKQARYRQALFLYEQTHQTTHQTTAVEFATQALAHYQRRQPLATSVLSAQTAAQTLDLLTHLDSSSPAATFKPSPTRQIQAQIETVQQLSWDSLPPSRALVDSQVSLAQSLLTLGTSPRLAKAVSPEQVLILLNRAYAQATALEDDIAQSQVLGTLGHLYEVWDHPEQARQVTQQALTLAQSLQASHLTYQWQWQLGRLSESQRAIDYYQAAVTSLKDVRQDLRAVDTDIRFSLRDNVEPLYRELVSLLLGADNQPPQANLKQAIQGIDALQLARLEDFLSCNLTQQVALNDAQTDPTAAIVYPMILPDQLAVIVQLPQSEDLQFYRTQISATDVTQTLDNLRQQLERPFILPDFFVRSQQVYDWLIHPIEAALKEQAVDTLVFVSDGALRNVPMSVLHDGQQFLIENYAVALSPSLRLPASRSLAKLGADTLAFGLSETRSEFSPHQGFAPLHNVETELTSIQAKVSSQNLLNQQFTSHNLQKLMDEASSPVLHLATHGQFSSNPGETFLLAWDRRLSLDDLGQLLSRRTDQRAIELLVLSACKTAAGDSRATLGLAGVAIQSGARSTIASLWNVNDVATSELMGQLYQALSESTLSRAQALRQAQLALLNTRGFKPPFYWSSFVLVGNWG